MTKLTIQFLAGRIIQFRQELTRVQLQLFTAVMIGLAWLILLTVAVIV